ncbi:hypothetical protein FB451DRAFT_1238218 [Mycena latifolia]|nr:hypothetical protein FB451DRAFT_1238218 [Mycena latifolia]
MPKEESSARKKLKGRRKAPPKTSQKPSLPVEAPWWRQSSIRRSRKISRTLALKHYKLEPSDLEGLPFSESPVTVSSPDGDLNLTVSLYNECMVERVAWIKYGGPEAFESFLNSLRNDYLEAHPLGAWEFEYPPAYFKTQTDNLKNHSSSALFDDAESLLVVCSPVSNADAAQKRSRTKTQYGAEVPLFSTEPLVSRATRKVNSAKADIISGPIRGGFGPTTTVERSENCGADSAALLPAFVEIFPTLMQNLRCEFRALNCTWLWDTAIRVLAFPSDIPIWYHLTTAERDTALRELFEIARTYPPRPAAPPPASLMYAYFRDVLERAPSLMDKTRSKLVLHEFFGGHRIWLWDEHYMGELFAALIAIINGHGCGEEGWLSLRWEVYDTFSSNLQGLSYQNNRWYDGASDWLRGRMELPGEHAVTARQDNSSDLGRWYNSLLPSH